MTSVRRKVSGADPVKRVGKAQNSQGGRDLHMLLSHPRTYTDLTSLLFMSGLPRP